MFDRLNRIMENRRSRTALMGIGAVVMALLGALVGHTFLIGKPVTPEENPSVSSHNPTEEFPPRSLAEPNDELISGQSMPKDSDDPGLSSDSLRQSELEPVPGLTPENDDSGLSAETSFTESSSVDASPAAAAESRVTTMMSQHEIADEYLRSGSYAQAVRIYQELRTSAKGADSASLLFRLALCAEAAGNHPEALTLYQRITSNNAVRSWAGVAAMGEARCLMALNQHDVLQTEWLRRVLLDETSVPPTARQEILHTLGRSQWQQLAAEGTNDLLDDRTMVVPDWLPESHEILDSLKSVLKEGPSAVPPPELTVLQNNDSDPNAVFVRVHTNGGTVARLISTIVQQCEFESEFSEAASAAINSRTVRIHVSDRSLSLLLDGLTMPFGNLWQYQGSRISIVTFNEAAPELRDGFRQQAADRILRAALLEAPDSSQTGCSRLALGSLLFRHGNPAEAAHVFRVQLGTSPRSSTEVATAFNLGKCLMSLSQRPAALPVFLQIVDSASVAADLKVAGYLYAGRLQIELGHTREATATLMRGLALSQHTAIEPQAALLLASSYLLNENPQAANSILMGRREVLNTDEFRDAAAFLSANARFHAAVLKDRREREGRSLVSALSHFHPDRQFGSHWSLLAADAAEQLGLTARAAELYLQTLQRQPEGSLRHEALLKLAAIYRAENKLPEAEELLKSLSSDESDHLTNIAVLRTAELSLEQGRAEEALTFCRIVLGRESTPELRRAALRIMGQSYEQLKNHQAAVYCFSGMVPASGLFPTDSGSPTGATP